MNMVLECDRELWDGPRAGTEGALEFLGVDEVSPCGNYWSIISISTFTTNRHTPSLNLVNI